MPIEVPSNPKIYTTKYRDFRGVDYTNDASNVWYRRSPNGLNMLPALDGRPHKRHGWKIEMPPIDFYAARYGEYDSAEAYAVDSYVVYDGQFYKCTTATSGDFDPDDWTLQNKNLEQYKVDYFELNGADWLAFYNSLGLFFYSDSLVYANEYKPPIGAYSDSRTYKEGDYVYVVSGGVKTYYECTTAVSTPEQWVTPPTKWASRTETQKDAYRAAFPPSGASIDYTKSFFFEGQGTAAYYVFTDNAAVDEGSGQSALFMFDGTTLSAPQPKIPRTLIACAPDGAGTINEPVNLLTSYRTVSYAGDGSTYIYALPNGYETTEINGTPYPTGVAYVYWLGNNGLWVMKHNWSMSTAGVSIQFPNNDAPPAATNGEDNVLILYKPSGMTSSYTHKTLSAQTLTITKTVKTKQLQQGTGYRVGTTIHPPTSWTNTGSATTLSTAYANSGTLPKFALENPKKPLDSYVTCDIKSGGSWQNAVTELSKTFDSYSSTVTLSGKNKGKDVYNKYSVSTSSKSSATYSDAKRAGSNSMVFTRYKYVTTTYTRKYPVRIQYDSEKVMQSDVSVGMNAFYSCSRSHVYGNGLINQVFLTATADTNFTSRVWYSMATDPLYFPDTNYMEVGATDKKIMGLINVGEYLGVVKQGSGRETSVYLAYPTSFENETTYAVKQSINGVGAVSNGAFNILNDEPLFLSEEGVMAIEPAEDDERKIRNRSYYINKPLLGETDLAGAVSFVYDGMYWLCTGNHAYVLDGSQKNSWENTKTNLQYEAYYLENIPAKCFAKKDGLLWFVDNKGNVCRFKTDLDNFAYADEYNDGIAIDWESSAAPVDGVISKSNLDNGKMRALFFGDVDNVQQQTIDGITYEVIYIGGVLNLYEPPYIPNTCYVTFGNADVSAQDVILYVTYNVSDEALFVLHNATTETYEAGKTYAFIATPQTEEIGGITVDVSIRDYNHDEITDWDTVIAENKKKLDAVPTVGDVVKYGDDLYTITEVGDNNVVVSKGVPIHAVWSTIADDDGSAHYLKNLQKKGSLVAVLPDDHIGVTVHVKADEKEEVFSCETSQGIHVLPFNVYMKKKLKKYKRLQIICENNNYNEPFGVDEIIKCYTIGNYAKK